MKTKEDILKELANYTGTEQYHKSTFGALRWTDGIVRLAELCQSYWFLDIIESVKDLEKIKENGFIVWKIEVKENKWKVTAWDDIPYESNLLYKQEGEYTDFPLETYEFYQIDDVLLLTSEY